MMPGRAIGSTSRNDTASLPKKRKRCSANATALPSSSAITVARRPTVSELTRASRMRWSPHARWYHLVE